MLMKLEFGNPFQIKELKRQAELAESDTWQLEMEISGSITVTVEGAKTEREAKELAWEKYFDDLINSSDISFYDIKKIPPKKPAPETLSMSLFMNMFEVGDADGSK